MTIYYLFYFFCSVVGLCVLLILAQLGTLKWSNFFYLVVLALSCSVFAYIVRPPDPNKPMNALFLSSLRSSRMMNCDKARIYFNQAEHYRTLLNKDYESLITGMRRACLNEYQEKKSIKTLPAAKLTPDSENTDDSLDN